MSPARPSGAAWCTTCISLHSSSSTNKKASLGVVHGQDDNTICQKGKVRAIHTPDTQAGKLAKAILVGLPSEIHATTE